MPHDDEKHRRTKPEDARPVTLPPDSQDGDDADTPEPAPKPHHHHHETKPEEARAPSVGATSRGLMKAAAQIFGLLSIAASGAGGGGYVGYHKASGEIAQREERVAELEQLFQKHLADVEQERRDQQERHRQEQQQHEEEVKAQQRALADLELRLSNQITTLTTTVQFHQQTLDRLSARIDQRRQPRAPPSARPTRPGGR